MGRNATRCMFPSRDLPVVPEELKPLRARNERHSTLVPLLLPKGEIQVLDVRLSGLDFETLGYLRVWVYEPIREAVEVQPGPASR